MTQSIDVALCVTCIVDQLMPEIGVATVKLLRRAGCQVDFPAGQTCCGQPFFNSGFREEAVRLAKRTIEIFEPYERVVLPSGSCTSMICVEYPHLLAPWPDWRERAERLSAKAFELSGFLLHEVNWLPDHQASGLESSEMDLTYHDSCHMLRLLNLHDEPRQLLASAGCPLREMKESSRCCGFGGLFSLRLPEVSAAMTAEKLRQATGSGAAVLVTADPGCLMQMRGQVTSETISVQHLAVVLEEMTR